MFIECHFKAIQCPELLPMEHAILRLPVTTDYYSSTHYQCEQGYRLPSGQLTNSIKCEADGSWSNVQPCQSNTLCYVNEFSSCA